MNVCKQQATETIRGWRMILSADEAKNNRNGTPVYLLYQITYTIGLQLQITAAQAAIEE